MKILRNLHKLILAILCFSASLIIAQYPSNNKSINIFKFIFSIAFIIAAFVQLHYYAFLINRAWFRFYFGEINIYDLRDNQLEAHFDEIDDLDYQDE